MVEITAEAASDISTAIPMLARLSDRTQSILLGPIPVKDEDGLVILGHLRESEDYKWVFEPATYTTPDAGDPEEGELTGTCLRIVDGAA
ncbi:hypothetical protein G7068_16255 [Leucobacter viscericola]|uniref:Uncharacterized protein n=1 Tax=Leucobacter viscericola TaxID=2714935 RepID=A0A6G7XJ25_9MICO|nr:hypothetical protein [Leucobacter viscericola]QIK64526.1 hypothetical protein G7068_15885 [Leucobacter viscericola]QIK64600.1 hypothetical protein G7068_16255 [Leucobacter viscericola]